MVTVYVWMPSEAADFKANRPFSVPQNKVHQGPQLGAFSRSVGHAAIHVENANFDLYFSLYPDSYGKELLLLTSPNVSFPAQFSVDYDVDFESIGADADYSVQLRNLDENAICSQLDRINSKYSQYILFKKNCASLVLELLKEGSKNLSPSNFKTASDFVKKVGGVLEVFAFFYELHNPIDMKMRGYHFSSFKPLKAAFSLYEICGGATPEAAYNYARFLKEEIG